jgi:chorismate mutase
VGNQAVEKVRAARGAIRVAEDAPATLLSATQRLLDTLLKRNEVDPTDIVSVFFTATDDLRSAFPAEAARQMGLGHVPLLCAREIPVKGSMHQVVRILMHFYTRRAPDEVVHAYLDGAESLRDDLG